MRAATRRIFFRESGALVGHCEAAVRAHGHFNVVSVIGFVEICQKLFGRIVLRAACCRAVQLPEILEAGRFVNGLPVFGRAAFSFAIIHQRDPRMNGVHQLRRA